MDGPSKLYYCAEGLCGKQWRIVDRAALGEIETNKSDVKVSLHPKDNLPSTLA